MPAKLIAQLAATLIVGAVVGLDYLDGGLDPGGQQHPILAASLLVWCELFIAFGIRAALEQRQQVKQPEIRTRRPETPCRCFCCRAVNTGRCGTQNTRQRHLRRSRERTRSARHK